MSSRSDWTSSPLKPSELHEIHAASMHNKSELVQSDECHCFCCLNSFSYAEITLFVDGNDTAVCPKCGIDSVVSSGVLYRFQHPVPVLLKAMSDYWFGRGMVGPESMDLKLLQTVAHRTACLKGFWDPRDGQWPNIPEKLMLVVSEVSEALEECRDGRVGERVFLYEKDGKPEGFGIELADAIIRIADIAEYFGIDLARMCRIKTAYNEKRPKMHGKKL